MSEAIASVIVAAAQSVAKVFVIGFIGYGAVKFPRNAPFLPRSLVGTVARFTFHAFTLPLVYSTIAVAVSPQSLGNYWFLIVGGWFVLGTSYLVATFLRYFFSITNQEDFVALRIAITYPNIVALPILIFPSLCEFPVVYEGYAPDYLAAVPTAEGNDESISGDELRRECVAQSTTMIFCYFFAWSLAFWSFGHPQLMRAAKANNQNHHPIDSTQTTTHAEHSQHTTSSNGDSSKTPKIEDLKKDSNSVEKSADPEALDIKENMQPEDRSSNRVDRVDLQSSCFDNDALEGELSPCPSPKENTIPRPVTFDEPILPSWKSEIWNIVHPVWKAVKQTTTSPGFVAMALAFVTACIPPLQRAIFEPGGPLRFFGSAVEALGTASSSISTMVVAASLVPSPPIQDDLSDPEQRSIGNNENEDEPVFDDQPGMTDPNFGPYQRPTHKHRRSSRFREMRRSLRSSSIRLLQAVPRSTPEMRRLHLWFCLSRLLVAPAAVVGLILAFDCSSSTILNSVPNLAKLVIIVNASLPGALIIVVLLKAKEECSDTAAAVSKVYLPSYLLSIFTIAAWCAVGMWITIPDEQGNTFCQR